MICLPLPLSSLFSPPLSPVPSPSNNIQQKYDFVSKRIRLCSWQPLEIKLSTYGEVSYSNLSSKPFPLIPPADFIFVSSFLLYLYIIKDILLMIIFRFWSVKLWLEPILKGLHFSHHLTFFQLFIIYNCLYLFIFIYIYFKKNQ